MQYAAMIEGGGVSLNEANMEAENRPKKSSSQLFLLKFCFEVAFKARFKFPVAA